jgi:NAD(P)H-quinone oxidoreductase subunit K
MVLNINSTTEDKERIINPIERTTVTQELSENVILTTVDDLYNWARLSSLWPLLFGTACCFIEFAALIGSRFDFDRFGLIPRSSPRQADLIITSVGASLRTNAGTQVCHRYGSLYDYWWDV